MHKMTLSLPAMYLVGVSARTSNQAEMAPETASIAPTIGRFYSSSGVQAIQQRIHPGKVFYVYTDYESDMSGQYTYFVGEEVSLFTDIPAGLETLTIPAQTYTCFTTSPGPMPQVCIEAWQKIWQMPLPRAYKADFETYDFTSPTTAEVTIHIGTTP